MGINPETKFQERVQKWLKTKGWKYIKIQQKSLCGDPDLVVCVNGIYIELELKRSKSAKVDRLQLYELSRTLKSGGYAFVCYPENWDKVQEFLVLMSHCHYRKMEIPECLKLKTLN